MITDKLASYGAAKREVMPAIEHRQHKDVSATLTTIVLDDSSLRWLETCT
jgi:hypothetical protein